MNGQTPAYRTDPLAANYRQTGQQTTTSGQRRRVRQTGTVVPPNPYEGTGTRAGWSSQEQRWIPEAPAPAQAPSTPWWEKIATPIATIAAAPFSGGAQQDIGQWLGNTISSIPGVGQVAESAANTIPEPVVNVGSYLVREATGVNSLGAAGRALEEGRYGDFLGNIALGAGQLYAGAAAGAPSASGAFGASDLGRTTLFGGPVRTLFGRATTPGMRGSLAFGTALTGLGALGNMSASTADQAERMAQQPAAPATAGPRAATPGEAAAWQEYYQSRQAAQQVAEEAASIPDLSAAEQQYYDNLLASIDAETQAILAELGVAETGARRTAEEETTLSRQRVAGGSQDIASALAFMGLDTSPGVLGVGQEAQAQAGARREQAIQQTLADQIAQFESQRAEAQRRQRAEQARIITERELERQRKIEEEARRQQELALLQGGY